MGGSGAWWPRSCPQRRRGSSTSAAALARSAWRWPGLATTSPPSTPTRPRSSSPSGARPTGRAGSPTTRATWRPGAPTRVASTSSSRPVPFTTSRNRQQRWNGSTTGCAQADSSCASTSSTTASIAATPAGSPRCAASSRRLVLTPATGGCRRPRRRCRTHRVGVGAGPRRRPGPQPICRHRRTTQPLVSHPRPIVAPLSLLGHPRGPRCPRPRHREGHRHADRRLGSRSPRGRRALTRAPALRRSPRPRLALEPAVRAAQCGSSGVREDSRSDVVSACPPIVL
jgi:hypothetical protein